MSMYNDKKDFVDTDIYFIEPSDIDFTQLKLKSYVTFGNPALLMVYSNECVYCSIAKPEFIQLSKLTNNITCLAYSLNDESQTSDSPSVFDSFIKKVYSQFQGVPTFLMFDSNGNFIKVYKGERVASEMLKAFN